MKLILIVPLLMFSFNLFANEAAKITAVKGNVVIEAQNGSTRKAVVDELIEVNEKIVTFSKSYIKVTFIDSSQTTVGPSSELVVEAFSANEPGVINLVKGSLRSKVSKDYMKIDKNSSKLFIKTKSASMGVRGTEFLWTYDPDEDQTGLVTIEGVVRFVKFDNAEQAQSIDPRILDGLLNSPKAVTVTRGQGSYAHPKFDRVQDSENLPSDLMREIKKMDLTARAKVNPMRRVIAARSQSSNSLNPSIVSSSDNNSEKEKEKKRLKKELKESDSSQEVANSSSNSGQPSVVDLGESKLKHREGEGQAELAFPLNSDLKQNVASEAKSKERDTKSSKAKDGKEEELPDLKLAGDEESIKDKANKRRMEQEDLLVISQREKQAEETQKARDKIKTGLLTGAAKGKLGGGVTSALKKDGVINPELKRTNIKDALNEKDGQLDSNIESELNKTVKEGIDSTQTTSDTLINKLSTPIKLDTSSTTTSSTTTTIRSVVNSVVSLDSSGTVTDSSGTGSEVKTEDELKKMMDDCIADYKKKHPISSTAPISAFTKRNAEAQAYCQDKVYGSPETSGDASTVGK